MVGFGYDVHRLAAGESLILGGVTFEESSLGTVAHSDGDVLLHAIMDALLGSLALGDIGQHFPDTEAKYKGVSSLELLRHVKGLVNAKGVVIVNIDSMVVLEAPRLRPHVETMRRNIASALDMPFDRVSIKATTNEKLGFLGRQEGIAAYAICEVR